MKKLLYLLLLSLLLISAWVFREPALRSMGRLLVSENELAPVATIFVLGGGAFDRANEAAKLYKAGYSARVVCTGGDIPGIMKVLGLKYSESEVSQLNLIKNNGLPPENVKIIPKGTSTIEESRLILDYCISKRLSSAMVLSSKFHTRRVKRIFKPLFEKEGITLIIRGAPSSDYSEEEWWKTEEGLIMVNNEFVKIIYYWFKY